MPSLRTWLLGLTGAAINSLANAVVAGYVDPQSFNPFVSGDWSKLASLMIVSAGMGAFLYLKTHPIPGTES